MLRLVQTSGVFIIYTYSIHSGLTIDALHAHHRLVYLFIDLTILIQQ